MISLSRAGQSIRAKMTNEKLNDALIWSVKNGDLEEVKKLIAKEVRNRRISFGWCKSELPD